MRRTGLVVVAALAIIVQVSLLPALRPFGVVPNLLLGLVALVGLEGTASWAVLLAVTGGVTADLAAGANFGLWTGTLVIAALVTGLVHRAGIEAVGMVAGGIVVVGTILMDVAILVGVAPAVAHWPVGWILGRVGLEIGLNLILVALMRPAVRLVVPASVTDHELRGVGV